MTSVQTTKLVGCPWSDLFNLVLDVKSYPQFVPHCHDVRLLSRKTPEPGMTVIVSRMTVGFSAFEVGYSNRTTGDAIGVRLASTLPMDPCGISPPSGGLSRKTRRIRGCIFR